MSGPFVDMGGVGASILIDGAASVHRPSHQRHATQRRAVQGMPSSGGFTFRLHLGSVFFLPKSVTPNHP